MFTVNTKCNLAAVPREFVVGYYVRRGVSLDVVHIRDVPISLLFTLNESRAAANFGKSSGEMYPMLINLGFNCL